MRAILAAVLLLATNGANAADGIICYDYERFTGNLKQKFAEKRVFSGQLHNGMPAEVWISASGSFTVVVIQDGKACHVLDGQEWTALGDTDA